MPAAAKKQSSSLVPRDVGVAVSRLPGAVLGRVWGEAECIWSEARALSRKPVSSETLHADAVYVAWYAGLVSMAALKVIEWRLAAMVAAVHTVERFGRRASVRAIAEGLDSGL